VYRFLYAVYSITQRTYNGKSLDYDVVNIEATIEMSESDNVFSEVDLSSEVETLSPGLMPLAIDQLIDTSQPLTNKHLTNASDSNISLRSPSSPLKTSSPLVEIRKKDNVTVHALHTPIRSRSNSHSSLSGLENESKAVDLSKVSTRLEEINIAVQKDESCTSITQEIAFHQKEIQPIGPLPRHLNPHAQGSSAESRTKITASPYSPTKRQVRTDSRSSIPTQSPKGTAPKGTTSKSKKSSASTTFASPVDIQSCANAVCIVPLEEADEAGALVLTAAADGMVRLINAVSGRVTRSYEGLSERTLCVAVSHPLPFPAEEMKASLGRPRIIAAGSRGGLCIWDYHSGAQLHVVETDVCLWGVAIVATHDTPIKTKTSSDQSSADKADDNAYAVILGACSDGQVHAWRSDTGKLLNTFELHEDAVLCIAQHTSPMGGNPVIITGGADSLVHLWDYPSGNAHHILSGHSDDVTAVSFVAEEDLTLRAVSGSRDKTIRVWDVKTGHCMAELTGHSDLVCGVVGVVTSLFPSFGPAAGPDGMLIDGQERKTDPIDDEKRSDSSGGDIESIGTSETSDGDGVAPLTAPHGKKHYALSHSRGENSELLIVASCGADGAVCLWDVYQSKLLVTSRLHKECVKGVTAGPVTIKNSQGMISTIMLASCSWDKNVIFYQLNTMLKGKGGENCRCVVS
jgi:WD40 repeat protein